MKKGMLTPLTLVKTPVAYLGTVSAYTKDSTNLRDLIKAQSMITSRHFLNAGSGAESFWKAYVQTREDSTKIAPISSILGGTGGGSWVCPVVLATGERLEQGGFAL